MPVQTPVLPLIAHDSFSHVSLPNSPGRGIVLNVQRSLPVFTSNARTRPFVLLCVTTVMPSLNEEPTRTTSFTTVGVEWSPISPSLYSGRVPRLSVLKRHATSRSLKFDVLI